MIDELRNDIAELVSLYEEQRHKVDTLTSALARKDEELRKCREQITDLNSQIDNLHLMNAFMAGTDVREARQRIDRIIKEIDKCIELLEV